MPTAPVQHAVLEGVRFETYERLLDDLGDRQIRLTYDRGVLEIVSPSQQHERIKYLIGRLVCAMTLELGIPILGGGSTTWRRQDLEKGLEPDECFWVKNEAKIRGRMDLDLRVDPPPDLAVEVDVHAQSLDRMVIYGALGVPEVWRYRDARITVHLRQEDGSYDVSETSACFPWLPMPDLTAWLIRACSGKQDETSLMRAFQQWVRSSKVGPDS
ncbi:MAG: Uma2 family endonuclease [Planctomycetota bacterium]|jgi:Uma2 family endonuclease